MNSIQSLPGFILTEIFSNFDRTTEVKVQLVNRYWRSIIQKKVWSRLDLTVRGTSGEDVFKYIKSYGKWIKKIEIDLSKVSIHQIFKACPNLTVGTFYAGHKEDLNALEKATCDSAIKFESLELYVCTYDLVFFANFYEAFKSLSNLTLKFKDFECYDDNPFELFDDSYEDDVRRFCANFEIKSYHPKLRTLNMDVGYLYPSYIKAIGMAFPNLVELHINLYEMMEEQDSEDLKISFYKLKNLKLINHGDDESNFTQIYGEPEILTKLEFESLPSEILFSKVWHNVTYLELYITEDFHSDWFDSFPKLACAKLSFHRCEIKKESLGVHLSSILRLPDLNELEIRAGMTDDEFGFDSAKSNLTKLKIHGFNNLNKRFFRWLTADLPKLEHLNMYDDEWKLPMFSCSFSHEELANNLTHIVEFNKLRSVEILSRDHDKDCSFHNMERPFFGSKRTCAIQCKHRICKKFQGWIESHSPFIK